MSTTAHHMDQRRPVPSDAIESGAPYFRLSLARMPLRRRDDIALDVKATSEFLPVVLCPKCGRRASLTRAPIVDLGGELERTAVAQRETTAVEWLRLREELASRHNVDRWLIQPGAGIGPLSVTWGGRARAVVPQVFSVFPAGVLVSEEVQLELQDAGVKRSNFAEVAGGGESFDGYSEILFRRGLYPVGWEPMQSLPCSECQTFSPMVVVADRYVAPEEGVDFLSLNGNINDPVISERVARILIRWVSGTALTPIMITAVKSS